MMMSAAEMLLALMTVVMVVVMIKTTKTLSFLGIALKMRIYHHYLPLLHRTTSGLLGPPPGLDL